MGHQDRPRRRHARATQLRVWLRRVARLDVHLTLHHVGLGVDQQHPDGIAVLRHKHMVQSNGLDGVQLHSSTRFQVPDDFLVRGNDRGPASAGEDHVAIGQQSAIAQLLKVLFAVKYIVVRDGVGPCRLAIANDPDCLLRIHKVPLPAVQKRMLRQPVARQHRRRVCHGRRGRQVRQALRSEQQLPAQGSSWSQPQVRDPKTYRSPSFTPPPKLPAQAPAIVLHPSDATH